MVGKDGQRERGGRAQKQQFALGSWAGTGTVTAVCSTSWGGVQQGVSSLWC